MLAPRHSFVDLVIRIDSGKVIVQTGANHGKKYVMLDGVDMKGEHIGWLRLRTHENDLEIGNICILRGLKVTPHSLRRLSPLQSHACTAIEDVSHVPEITEYFH